MPQSDTGLKIALGALVVLIVLLFCAMAVGVLVQLGSEDVGDETSVQEN